MANRPWRTGLGLAAVFLWSLVIGFPVLLFHLQSPGLMPGEHLHAAILFGASQVLVFWMVARPQPPSKKKRLAQPAREVAPAMMPLSAPQGPEVVWEAELVSPVTSENPAPLAAVPAIQGLIARISIGNYMGSSRPRQIMIEPGEARHTLLPGQILDVTATGRRVAPTFRIVESDLATQIAVEGETSEVKVVKSDLSSHHAPP